MDRLSTKGQMIDQIDLRAVPHSGFDRSNHNYLTGKLGALIPTRLDEVYPGDRIKGSPQMVCNFEPLAAPLMGSMVLKQESFFVPLPQVWKHAYKFFTGKNGFDENIPSISPQDIFKVYSEAGLGSFLYSLGTDEDNSGKVDYVLFRLNKYYADLQESASSTYKASTGEFFYETMLDVCQGFYDTLFTMYSTRKMFDLVLPIYKEFEKFCKSDYVNELSVSFEHAPHYEEVVTQMYEFIQNLGAELEKIHQFFFGPSSLFDYLGWPITLHEQFNNSVYEPLQGTYIKRTIFVSALWSNVLDFGSEADFQDTIAALFSEVPLNFLPFKAHYLIWYWNYRDQLLETGILDPEEDEFLGSDITDNMVLYCTLMRQRCWFKDAYTTALTNTGEGNLLVPTYGIDSDAIYTYYDGDDNPIEGTTDALEAYNAGATICKVSNGDFTYKIPMNYLRGVLDSAYGGSTYNNSNPFFSLDLFDRIQRLRSFLQKKLILGYEVDDVIWSSFMVRLSNVRMHIPELLGRGRDAVEISTLVNNTSTQEQIAGDKTATAWVKGSISEVNYFAEEWGFYMQYATILPIQSYAGGMQRLYLKKDPFDYMWPEFATMGMDAVYNCELAALGSHLSDENGLKVFGYQGRYYDLKYRQDEEHGRLLTDLNYLTFSREFNDSNLPKLNYMFVHCWPRLDGFVVESQLEDVFRADCYTAQGWERRLPVPSQFVH